MTRSEAEALACLDAQNGEHRQVPAASEAWYESALAEEIDQILRRKRAEFRRKGITVPWWEVYRT